MGYGNYSTSDNDVRATLLNYAHASREQIFTQKEISSDMSPMGIKFRESRDSDNHPESLPIILGLDVTGSMGYIPHQFIREGLPTLMGTLVEKSGISDIQLMLMGIGDHKVDRAPLQVAQFETSDELLDKWLKMIWLESGGGSNGGESYHLAWYFASQHTVSDAWDKRKQKGFLFTIGNELVHKTLSNFSLTKIMGVGEYNESGASYWLEKAKEHYIVVHFHITSADSYLPDCQKEWKELLKENVFFISDYKTIPTLMTEYIINHYKPVSATKTKSTIRSKEEIL
jgi:hypothetical protein